MDESDYTYNNMFEPSVAKGEGVSGEVMTGYGMPNGTEAHGSRSASPPTSLRDVVKGRAVPVAPPKTKIHKSCDYCRHRKVKCVVAPGNTVCDHCTLCGVECVFSPKLPSQKRKLKSARIAATVQELARRHSSGASAESYFSPPSGQAALHHAPVAGGGSTGSVDSNDGTSPTGHNGPSPEMAPLPPVPARPSSFGSGGLTELRARLSAYELSDLASTPAAPLGDSALAEVYRTQIYPYTPFMPPATRWDSLSDLARLCLNIAVTCALDATFSPTVAAIDGMYNSMAQLLHHETTFDEDTVGALLIVAARSRMPEALVAQIMTHFNALVHPSPNTAIGAMSVYAWNVFAGSAMIPVPHGVQNYVAFPSLSGMDDQMFAYHFVSLSALQYRLNELTEEVSRGVMSQDQWSAVKRSMLKIENDLLLFPVRLPKSLTVVKDAFIATEGAIVFHVLHNAMLTYYYCNAIQHKEVARMVSVAPVPGILQFLAGMAASSFKCSPELIAKWPILRPFLVMTARFMVDLYKSTEYEFCKISLAFFTDCDSDRMLFEEIRQILGNVNWTLKYEDGAAIYWVFRDTRSMTLSALINDI